MRFWSDSSGSCYQHPIKIQLHFNYLTGLHRIRSKKKPGCGHVVLYQTSLVTVGLNLKTGLLSFRKDGQGWSISKRYLGILQVWYTNLQLGNEGQNFWISSLLVRPAKRFFFSSSCFDSLSLWKSLAPIRGKLFRSHDYPKPMFPWLPDLQRKRSLPQIRTKPEAGAHPGELHLDLYLKSTFFFFFLF